MTTAIAKLDAQLSVYDKIENPMTAVEQLGTWLAKSGMLGAANADQGKLIALTCMLERITPLEFFRTYHIIEGKPSMRADMMQGRFQKEGWKIDWLQYSNDCVQIRVSHAKELPGGFDGPEHKLEDYKKSGVAIGKGGSVKANWSRFPRRMLASRAISEAVRMFAPHIVAGIYTPEEHEDMNQEQAPCEVVDPETGEVTEAPQEPPTNKEHRDRVKKVEASFASMGVGLGDLEKHLDTPAEYWTDTEFEKLSKIRTEIKEIPSDERQAIINRVFKL